MQTHPSNWFGLVLITLAVSAARADIATDGSLGSAVQLSGPNMRIGAELGQTRSGNLFHSFQHFEIASDQSATFTGSDSINNVIGRITGGRVSRIDGTLRSEVGQADVYLINPSGVVMGPDARVEVPAALHLSTADELRFTDGGVFSAADPTRSTLTMAAPESFGFLSPQPGRIQLNGTRLEVQPGQTASLTAGDVGISGTAEHRARISAPGGTVRVEAVGAAPAELPLEASALEPRLLGNLELNQADLTTSGEGGGALMVRAGEARFTDSTLAADNLGAMAATGGVDLAVTHGLALHGSRVQSNVFADGGSGGLRVTAGTLNIEQAEATTMTGLWSEVEPGAGGQAGDIAVVVRDALRMRGAVGIASATFGAGAGGAVAVRAPQLWLDGEGVRMPYRNTLYLGGIASEVGPGAQGAAGGVSVDVADALVMRDSGAISSSTQGEGAAGSVRVRASALDLDGALVWIATSVWSGAGAQAAGGDLSVEVDGALTLAGGAAIAAETQSQGAAGRVRVEAGEAVLSDLYTRISADTYLEQDDAPANGAAGDLRVAVRGDLTLLAGARISSSTFGRGAAGRVSVSAGALNIDGGVASGPFAGIRSQNYLGPDGSRAGGPAGDILIDVAGPLRMSNHALIGSATFSPAPAGRIHIRAGDIDLQAGALISSDTYDAGPGGAVQVRAENLSMSGNAEWISRISTSAQDGASGAAGAIDIGIADRLDLRAGAAIASDTAGQGDAGGLTIKAGVLEVVNGSTISNSTTASGDAGNLRIEADAMRLDGQEAELFTGILSEAYLGSTGNAGNLTLRITGLLEVLNAARISNSTFGEGDTGNLTIAAGALTLLDGGLIANSTFAEGNAGDMSIEVDGLTVSDGSYIASETQGAGDAGDLSIEAGVVEVLDAAYISSSTIGEGDAGDLRIEADAMRLDGQETEFLTGILSEASLGSTGNAGNLTLRITGLLEVLNAARISNTTFGEGDAGNLTIAARALTVLDSGLIANSTFSEGDAGELMIVADMLEVRNGAYIASDTWAAGNAGSVRVDAGDVRVDGQGAEGYTGIWSAAEPGSVGHAGEVLLDVAHSLDILNGGWISSGTWGAGDAGVVSVQATDIIVDGAGSDAFTGIDSMAAAHSTGQVGTLNIHAQRIDLRHGGQINIGAYQTLPDPTTSRTDARITIHADYLGINGGGLITTESTGNVPAAAIRIDGGVLLIQDGQITTSAEGSASTGGNIHLSPKQLILDGGFIQANAAADNASGGQILIDPQALLIPATQQLEVGGLEREAFTPGSGRNIIQAAAPGGEQGDITLTAPQLDLTASLVPLRMPLGNPEDLFTDACANLSGEQASTLVELGRGGLPVNAGMPVAMPVGTRRMKRLLLETQ